MTNFTELVEPIRKAIFPVCFDTNIQEMPYNTFGTCFLIKLECGIFALTLKHVVQETHVSDLFIFVPGTQIQTVRFNRRIDVTCPESPDDPVEDLVLLEVNPQTLSNNVPCYDLSKISNQWESAPEEYNYMVFGYPSDGRDIDSEKKHIECPQHSFSCQFSGKSMLEDCYKLTIDTEHDSGPEDKDGYSGSPVFAWHQDSTNVYEAVLVGVAIQSKGTTLNFLRRDVIDAVARKICS